MKINKENMMMRRKKQKGDMEEETLERGERVTNQKKRVLVRDPERVAIMVDVFSYAVVREPVQAGRKKESQRDWHN